MGNSFGCSYCLLILIGEEVGRCLDSFFFFSDNQLFMLKTMKESEFDIVMKQGFLLDYYKHITTNPDSLLMKIFIILTLGLYLNFRYSMVSHF